MNCFYLFICYIYLQIYFLYIYIFFIYSMQNHIHSSSLRCSIFAGFFLWYEIFTSCCCDLMAASGMSWEINMIMTSLSQAATVSDVRKWHMLAKHKEKKGVCVCVSVCLCVCVYVCVCVCVWACVYACEVVSPSVMLTLGNCTLISIRIIDTLN